MDSVMASVELLRRQVLELESSLAPGSDWDIQIHRAERTVQELRMARKKAESQLRRLHGTLQELHQVAKAA